MKYSAGSRRCVVVNIIPAIAAAFLVAASSQKTMPGEVLLTENFSNPGAFGKKLLSERHIVPLVSDGPDGSDAIRVSYVGYDRGSERVVVAFPLSRSVKRAVLSYDVRFGKDFQWVRGGKLHGLGPDVPVTGGNPRGPEKWSGRIMFGPGGRSRSYIYDQDLAKKYGVGDTSAKAVFKKGKWQHVDIEVKMNTPGKADGTFSVYVDGKRRNHEPAVEFRGSDSEGTLISKVLFSTFHGGHTPSYAPKYLSGGYSVVHADFDNFVVREGLLRGSRL